MGHMGPDAIGHDAASPGADYRACVVLRHDLPDGTWHYDLMLELRPGIDQDFRLATLRLTPAAAGQRALTLASGVDLDPQAPCQHLPDHRGLYLAYEGALSNNRGSVRRVAQGLCLIQRCDAEIILARLNLGAGWIQLNAARLSAAGQEGRSDQSPMSLTVSPSASTLG